MTLCLTIFGIESPLGAKAVFTIATLLALLFGVGAIAGCPAPYAGDPSEGETRAVLEHVVIKGLPTEDSTDFELLQVESYGVLTPFPTVEVPLVRKSEGLALLCFRCDAISPVRSTMRMELGRLLVDFSDLPNWHRSDCPRLRASDVRVSAAEPDPVAARVHSDEAPQPRRGRRGRRAPLHSPAERVDRSSGEPRNAPAPGHATLEAEEQLCLDVGGEVLSPKPRSLQPD